MKEADIRPAGLFNDFLTRVARDAEHLLAEQDRFVAVPCPGCGASTSQRTFVKHGYGYNTCDACATLFQTPRAPPEVMGPFYETSESVRFWSTDFFRQTEVARRERMFRPRAALVREWADKVALPDDATFVDIGCGYGVFLEEVAKLGRFKQVVGIEPAGALAEASRARGFDVVEELVEDIKPGRIGGDFASAFEVLEHVFDTVGFLKAAQNVLKPGGVLLFTTLTASGFDIKVLGEHAKCVHPPHHLNFMTVEGMRQLVERAGYEVLDLQTPGRLDVDIVRNTYLEDEAIPRDPFATSVCLDAPPQTREQFQDFLAANALSSHIRVLARVPGGDAG